MDGGYICDTSMSVVNFLSMCVCTDGDVFYDGACVCFWPERAVAVCFFSGLDPQVDGLCSSSSSSPSSASSMNANDRCRWPIRMSC